MNETVTLISQTGAAIHALLIGASRAMGPDGERYYQYDSVPTTWFDREKNEYEEVDRA